MICLTVLVLYLVRRHSECT